MTVVSLFPSATELAAALGATPAAVSHQCDRPPAVEDRPTLTGLVRDLDADPADLDRVAAHDDTYYLDGDRLAAADPDAVLTQGVCAVCALDAGLARRAVERLDLDAAVLDVHADDLADVLANVERVGEAVGRPAAAAALRDDLDARIDAVAGAVPRADATASASTTPSTASRPRVAVLDWTDPLRHAGLWVPDLIRIAGGEAGPVAAGERSRKIGLDELRAFDPEVVVIGPCSADVGEARRAAADLLERESIGDVTAVRDGRVYAMDGTAYLNRHSHRVVDTLEALAAVIHPDRFGEYGEKVRRVGSGAVGNSTSG
ncbi:MULTISPECIES: ABC transporter substrate-binding protein [unclassified Halorubrum]|uniref:ABC transporter substrate-binding protein n=1 Tax=unclassified Halorubrum TaxID=2642239 RepID=UPI000B990730|nr:MULTISPECIES: ABC transporter substrate-binding protein [unclassified Halorubrum]OYR46445.1 ABC transporter substrate-binding protein [Halorubrum sp. Hd13]OYR47895.1 ABC transporter substrate-binding protein [Halorubrum sp. Ea8]